ncbi:hypothetical protein [Dokdonella sp.]|uniref:hypothetical protein n=1 Tax=Dokdonella sp. TaxID=2291710 RepID=UPI0031C044CD|nr:hypothetical protein [Dokdonella sp.]
MNVHATRLTSRVLAGVCAALLLLAVLQYAGLGRGYGWGSAGTGTPPAPLGNIDQQPVQIPAASRFADIAAHPLFNDDRLPTPLDAAEAGDGEELPPPSPLNVALTGVILDEKAGIRIAMLQDKASNQSIALRVGMPLEGDQATWTLVEVKPRGAVFRSAADETAEVELETAAPAPPPRSARAGRAPAPARRGSNTQNDKAQAGSDASADLAKRIEERRKQMREEAERLRNASETPDAPPKK